MTIKTTDMLSTSQLDKVYEIADTWNVDPKLILAIGWHETQWGRLGDGKKGMYTGFGSFDSGSDYKYAGFDKQVENTTLKMSRWGMKPGNVTLAQLQAGQKGVLPTGIYATSPTWANSVYSIYNSIVEDYDAGSGLGTANSSEVAKTSTKTSMVDKFKAILSTPIPGIPYKKLGIGQGETAQKIGNFLDGNPVDQAKDAVTSVTGDKESWVRIGIIAGIGIIGAVAIFKALDISPGKEVLN